MSQTIRNIVAIAAGLFLLGSCTTVERIQQTEPVRTTKFRGSHKAIAQCIHQWVGGRVQDEAFGEKYVIHDSVKSQQNQGLTHYTITVGRTGPDQGIVEWRVINATNTSPSDMSVQPSTKLADAVVQRYWGRVEDCTASAKSVQ